MATAPPQRAIFARASKFSFLATVFLAVFTAAGNIRSDPALVDELGHVAAGLSYWDFGRHYLYRENPPFVRLLASLPVWLSNPNSDYRNADSSVRSEWVVGKDFIRANGARHHFLFGEARCVILCLAVASAYLIYVWANRCYGGGPAPVLASIWLLYPPLLAHATIATVDVGSCFFGLLAAYVFWRFLQRPGWSRTILVGITMGMAQGSKFSMLALYPALVLNWLMAFMARRRGASGPEQGASPTLLMVAAAFMLSVVVLDAIYLFDEVGKPLGSFQFRSCLLSGRPTVDLDDVSWGNRFRRSWLGQLAVPLPGDYVRGLDSQMRDAEVGFYRPAPGGGLIHGGAWYSSLLTLAFKLPLGTIALLLFSVLVGVARPSYLREEARFLLVIVVTLLAMLGIQTGLNWPARYSLPLIPFLALLMGGPVQAAWGHRLWRWAIMACVGWNVLSVTAAWPHFLAYGNELVGGMDGARHVFAGSDLDWGQDLYRLAAWRADHPELRPMTILYYGALNPDFLGLHDSDIPRSFLDSTPDEEAREESKKHLYLAVSANLLLGAPADVVLPSGRQAHACINPRRLTYDNAFAQVGPTIYLFEVVPTMNEGRTDRPILFDGLRSCLHEVSRKERRLITFP